MQRSVSRPTRGPISSSGSAESKLQGSQITDFLHSGHHPKRAGNTMRFAASSAYPAKEGLVHCRV